jgi:sensor histidine kinase YesM
VPFGDLEEMPEGVGLANTRSRLRHLYGNDHKFRLSSASGTGLRVDLEIPLQPAYGGPPPASK